MLLGVVKSSLGMAPQRTGFQPDTMAKRMIMPPTHVAAACSILRQHITNAGTTLAKLLRVHNSSNWRRHHENHSHHGLSHRLAPE